MNGAVSSVYHTDCNHMDKGNIKVGTDSAGRQPVRRLVLQSKKKLVRSGS